jgi:hypothetical protein
MHKTKPMIIDGKNCDIDEGIYEVVEFINNFDGIVTENSCEGGYEGTDFHFPYISFVSKNQHSLHTIIKCLKFTNIGHRLDVRLGLVYVIRFNDKEELSEFIEKMPEAKKIKEQSNTKWYGDRNVTEEWLFDIWDCATLEELEKKVQNLEARGIDRRSILLVIGEEKYYGQERGVLYLKYEEKS